MDHKEEEKNIYQFSNSRHHRKMYFPSIEQIFTLLITAAILLTFLVPSLSCTECEQAIISSLSDFILYDVHCDTYNCNNRKKYVSWSGSVCTFLVECLIKHSHREET